MEELLEKMKDVRYFNKYQLKVDGIEIIKCIFGSYNLVRGCLEASEEQIQAMVDSWDDTKKANDDIARHNKKINKEAKEIAEKFFNGIGMPTYKTSLYGKITGSYKEFKAVLKQIDAKFPSYNPNITVPKVGGYVDGDTKISVNYGGSIACSINVVKDKLEYLTKQDNNKTKLFQASVAKAESFGVNPMDSNVVELVQGVAEARFIAEEYPDGQLMDIDCCSECDTWIIGEHRCSCGNRRMYLTVEGNILDGFYAYAEAN